MSKGAVNESLAHAQEIFRPVIEPYSRPECWRAGTTSISNSSAVFLVLYCPSKFKRVEDSNQVVKYDYPAPQHRFSSQKNEIKRTADETLTGTKKKLFRADRKRHERDSPSRI